MVLDPKKHADWEIAQDAETRMKTVQQLGRDMGLLELTEPEPRLF